jgi:ABC-type Fe3+ transport system permease subunit
MVDFMRYGGFNMWVLLAIGIPAVVTAVKFARNASPERLSLIRALTWALVFSMVAGVAAGLCIAALHVVRDDDLLKEPLRPLLQGFAESLTNAILGGVLASITWILVAVGVRRMPRETN